MYKVAVVQFYPKLFDIDYNLSRMVEYTLIIDADLIVFPELATSGYVFGDRAEVLICSEDARNGNSIVKLSKVAQDKNRSVIFGFPEKDGDKLYNSSILLNPDGSSFLYRKIHLFNREKLFFDPGNLGFQVYPAKDGVQIGIMICFDWQFPEAARTLALKGAQIICHPSNLVLPWCQQAMITRSLENRVFTITSNRIGIETNKEIQESFTGQSQILGTKGEVLIRLDDKSESFGVAEIDPSLANSKTITERNDAFLDRRPEFYYA